ncbi:hypothetical protein J6TS2_50940 [Heyndrickxia sporothermodurans]|nr:hypothetical protein J6TS2_50940 [Heyndrickxia sporothermodurans]
MTTWDKVGNVRDSITSMFPFYKNNGTRELLVVSKSKLHKEENGTLKEIGNLASNKVKMLTYKMRNMNDVVLIADKGRLKAYNGTSISTVTPHVLNEDEQQDPGLNDLDNLTNFRTFTIKKDVIFAAAHPTVKNRVSFSYFDPYLGSGVYDYWPAIYFFDVATEDNDEIVELKVFRDALIIFCKRSVWALYGDGANIANLELVKINTPKGCISTDSICEVGNNLFYLAEDHVYSLFSTDRNFISAEVVSDSIFPILKSIGLSDKEKTVAVYHEDKYHLSFPSGLTLVYDISINAWTTFINVQANSFLVLDGILYFSSNDGFIYRFNENKYSDDGTPISFIMKSKIIDFELPVHRKKVKRMWVIKKEWAGYESSYDLFGMIDQYSLVDLKVIQVRDGAGGVWDVSTWDNALWDFSEIAQDEIKLRRKAKSMQIQISNSKLDEPLTIFGFVFEYKVKKP